MPKTLAQLNREITVLRKKERALEEKRRRKAEIKQTRRKLRALKYGKYARGAKKVGVVAYKFGRAYSDGIMGIGEKETRRMFGSPKKSKIKKHRKRIRKAWNVWT